MSKDESSDTSLRGEGGSEVCADGVEVLEAFEEMPACTQCKGETLEVPGGWLARSSWLVVGTR